MAEKETPKETPATETEKVKPEVGTLESFLNDGAKPPDIDKALEEDKNQANEQAKKEVEAMEKGEPLPEPEKTPADKPKAEKKPENPAKTEEEDLITPEFRTKYKVPDNIKTMKAFAEWGPNAEAAMRRAQSEKDRLAHVESETRERLARMEGMLDQFSKSLKDEVKDGTLSEEDRAIEDEKMRYLMETNPAEAFRQMKEQLKKDALAEKEKEQQTEFQTAKEKFEKEAREAQQKEYDTMLAEYTKKGEKEKFENEIIPALAAIAKEKPYLRSLDDAMIIYSHRMKIAEEKAAAEDEAKRKEKEGSVTETSHQTADVEGSEEEKKAKAIDSLSETASLDDLKKIAGVKR